MARPAAITDRRAIASARTLVRAHGPAIVAAAFMLGILERMVWAILHRRMGDASEATNVALSLASGHGFANALDDGAPTAHLTPSMVSLGGATYWLFGLRSALSESLLFVVATLLVLGAYALCFRLFRAAGLRIGWSVACLCALLVLPTYTSVEAIDFRLWEGGLALAMACLCLTEMVRADRAGAGRGRRVALGVGLAATFFVSPTAGAAAYAAWVLHLWRHRVTNGLMLPAIVGGLTLAIVLTPWTIRNHEVMHAFVPTRDNLGLETSLSYYPGADTRGDDLLVYWKRLGEVHPNASDAGRARMRAAGGEVAYNHVLLAGVERWVESHPGGAARITLRHIGQYLLPGLWQFPSPDLKPLGPCRWAIVNIISLLGLAGVASSLWSTDEDGAGTRRYLAATTLTLPLCYMIVHPIPRYFWLDYAFLAFWATLLVQRLTDAVRAREGASGRSARVVSADASTVPGRAVPAGTGSPAPPPALPPAR